jgi:hypothetical protein
LRRRRKRGRRRGQVGRGEAGEGARAGRRARARAPALGGRRGGGGEPAGNAVAGGRGRGRRRAAGERLEGGVWEGVGSATDAAGFRGAPGPPGAPRPAAAPHMHTHTSMTRTAHRAGSEGGQPRPQRHVNGATPNPPRTASTPAPAAPPQGAARCSMKLTIRVESAEATEALWGGRSGLAAAPATRAWPGARPPPFRPPRHPADANHRLTWGSRAWRAPLRRLGGRRMRCAGAALRGRARGVAAPRKRRLSPGSGEPVAGVGSSRAARRRPRPHHSRAGRPRRGRPWRRPPRTATTTPGWSWPWSRWAEEGGGGAARFARRP